MIRHVSSSHIVATTNRIEPRAIPITCGVPFPDGEFVCQVDHFDAERDRFPYPDAHFDAVLVWDALEYLAGSSLFPSSRGPRCAK